MTEKKKILIVIDMQHDFVDGSLGTKEAQAIVPKVDNLIENGDFDEIYYTFDTHYPNYLNTLEGKKLPVKHCTFGTNGWALSTNHSPNAEKYEVVKNTFGYINWDHKLSCVDFWEDDKKPNIESITIVGLCTDICVISNALILRAYLPNTPIIVDASCCAGTTPEAHKAALTVMKSCQIDVINE